MIIERDVDCGELYQQQRHDLMTLARSLTDQQLQVTVPASPAWSVHDVVAHLVGITADLNAGRFGANDGDAWTDDQVRPRRDDTIEQLGIEWEAEAPTFEEGLRLLGYRIGSHYIGDLLQHQADIDHALGLGRLRDGPALVSGLDFYLDTFHETLLGSGDGSVNLRIDESDGEKWELGSGPVVASVTAGRFDAFRCFGGRRSKAQVRAMDWTGDVDRVLDLVSPYPLPLGDIIEG